MKAAGKIFEPVIYDGAGHGFMRAGEAPDASDANRQARNEAWARWKKLMRAAAKEGQKAEGKRPR
jgi:carboxymethylenebutenolidase